MIFLTGSQMKVLGYVTTEWQAGIDIAHWAGYSNNNYCAKILKQMENQGMVESKWDGDLGVRYWRLKS